MSAIGIEIKKLVFACLVLPTVLVSFAASADSDSTWKDGSHVYAKVCGHCHETSGDIGPVLSGRNLPPEYITSIVRNGFRAMPAFPASFVDDKALQQVGEYIQALPAKDKE